MTSKAQRRRRKITLPGGQEVPQPATQGRRTDLKAEDARKATLQARMARGGMLSAEEIKAASTALDLALAVALPEEKKAKVRAVIKRVDDARKAKAGSDMFETDVGYCANFILSKKDAAAVIDTFNHLRASYRNYMFYFIGQTGNAKTAAIAMIPEPMETDQSLRVDLRTHDEKVRAAKASWAQWEKRMAALPVPQMRWALGSTLRGFLGDGTLWRDGKPTHTGQTVVAALKAMGA